MKMPADMYAKLRESVMRVLLAAPSARAMYREHGLSDERFRWDAYNGSDFDKALPYKAGLNDSHIDTALRKVVAESEVQS